ncbi:MAG: dihydroorotate dehydrogenase electron transfer subunit, partial [Actinomycetota bacterium]|nr:dihydroorotate dehydrogenase electron transfer subunit [Actinomycetota bacterium]
VPGGTERAVSSVVAKRSVPTMQGRAQGPLRGRCEVLAQGRVGAYHSLTFVAPEMADRTRPGQFVSVGVEGGGTVLRRPFSVYAVSRHGPWAGTIEIVFDVVGPGTAWLSQRTRHDVVDLVGPLGRSFPLPQQPVPCLLVGGGYGAAPLLYLANHLQQRGLRVDLVMGAANQQRLFNVIEAKRLSASATFTTEDGSLGVRGLVTDVMEDVIESAAPGVVYACGPMPMLAAVAKVARHHRIACQVAVEEAMACGTGVCWTCVLPYRRNDGVYNLRACVEGPVFNGARVVWDAVGAGSSGVPVAGGVDRAQEEFRP